MTTEQNMNTQDDADLFEVSMDAATEKASAFIQSFVGQQGGLRALGLTTMVADRKSTRLNSSHSQQSRMPSSA